MTDDSINDRHSCVKSNIEKQLEQPEIRRALADLFSNYYIDFREIVTMAEVESEGIRPEGLANEVYAAFQHIARGLSEPSSDKQFALNEIEKARHSHLKRMALDSHKIVINRVLSDAKPILNVIDIIASKPELPELIDGGFETLAEIRKKRTEVKFRYLEAKRAEGRADDALTAYQSALAISMELRDEVEKLSVDKRVIYTLARDEEERKARMRAEKQSERSLEISAEANKTAKHSKHISLTVMVLSAIAVIMNLMR